MRRYVHTQQERQAMFTQIAETCEKHADTCEWVVSGSKCTCGFNEQLRSLRDEALRTLPPKERKGKRAKVHA